jgi:hypothetical protein
MLFGCAQERFDESDLVGRWVIAGSRSKTQARPTLLLKGDKTVVFQSVSANDVGLPGVGGDVQLPHTGEWRFQSEQNSVTFRYLLNGVTHDHSAEVDFKKRRLYFTIGDPDMMERIYYQKQKNEDH